MLAVTKNKSWFSTFFKSKNNNEYKLQPSTKRSKNAAIGIMFVLPALIFITIFLIIPVVLAFFYSFQNYNMLKPTQKAFIGLQNYIEILKNPAFYKSLMNTVYFAGIVVPLQTAVALGLAMLVNTKLKTSKLARICFFSPVITSMVVIAILWTFLYNKDSGLINSLLNSLGIPSQPFLLSEKQSMNSIILMSIWQAAGYQMMIFLAGLQDVSTELYEAASIDGGSAWDKFINVTLPGIKHVSSFVILITTIQAFKLFTQPYIMTAGGPNESTKTLSYMIYEQGFQYRNVGYSCAIAVIFFLVILVISGVIKKIFMNEEE
ncbi:sugar ABC transporter permease [uncultured Clostridium sp.]|uniref:carbohydrate ABC transporter permease n=1 Tax=uncultured Clostridium sp. TaxID=59620 RepID=UPI0028E9C151|nr:sugar ABC transporter permease [uncultured Clostridium sp.]